MLKKIKNKLNYYISGIFKLSISDTIQVLKNKKEVLFFHETGKIKNFGDDINPVLFEKLTGKRVVSKRKILNFRKKTVYFFIGSILHNLKMSNVVVIGSGFINSSPNGYKKPKKIVAVRGALTRDVFLKNNIDCPEVYCDPALLLPFFLKNNNVNKKYDVGIIAHFADKEILQKIIIESEGLTYKIIDISSEQNQFIKDLCDCKTILSSSLHGVIVAHAYKIPALWIKLSDRLIGGSFKFNDYATSAGVKEMYCYNVDKILNLQTAVVKSTLYDVKKSQNNLLLALKKENLLLKDLESYID
ncbi:polysaccharide pyruvyl transferase family protein [Tenacibaculum finnmarkense]|uniref:polysaccharide pyruvyl transferase family protein n=1 Tax=Tenacibaculum finnmarkense TaxID=2781243 RepID=UPI001EFA3FD7|nr:polysaccharide pyruvyl transferase family protein [Tenacibaculum finnmarkense]MCG8785885.1 polysaccharide pyruvyl transferase family protein [Tenacibaculum finnmarkense]MCG8813608.1 polysaccharide pyruvyl transferase family protein [Tenacibaculum finnmarkense]